MLVLLFACAPKEGDDTAVVDDTGESGASIAPDGYQYLWDIDAEDCAADGADAAVYYLFEGAIGTDASLAGTESWYWFFAGDGYDGDCVDSFTLRGDEATHSWSDDFCSQCERLFDTVWDLPDGDRTCSGFDYETFWDQEDVDRDRFETTVLFDALTPSGHANKGNAALVMTVWENGDGDLVGNYGYAQGTYTPDAEGDYEGGATVDWVAQTPYCVTFEEE
jgi:hypothetical protein